MLSRGLWGTRPAAEPGADAGLGPRSVDGAAGSGVWHISRRQAPDYVEALEYVSGNLQVTI